MTQEIDAIPSEEKPPKKTASSPPCVGCGGWHGGVGAGIICLEARVRQLETEIRVLKLR